LKKLYEEVEDVVGRNKTITLADLDNMKYLTNVVKESLRLHAPIGNSMRESVNDDVLKGVPIPKGVRNDFKPST